MSEAARELAARLSCWSSAVEPEAIGGGITNANFRVVDAGQTFFVRIGVDIPVHGVMRFNESAASRAAHATGISPAVVHQQPGALVLEFIEGRSLTAEDVRAPDTLAEILELVRRCHRELPKHLEGATLSFWVFQVLRDYARTLRVGESSSCALLPRLLEVAGTLEQAVGPIDVVFGHNDLLAGNLIHDGQRLWLIDWDYAGWGSPLFDLGGLASNNQLDVDSEEWLLANYYQRSVDDGLRRAYRAMKCASLLRETLWSMVSEIHSTLDVDFMAYTQENLARFESEWREFEQW